jgi:hypothetical protein
VNREDAIAALKAEIDRLEAQAVDEHTRVSLSGGKEGSIGMVVTRLAVVVGLRMALELLEKDE